jgi:hypothetical protein
MHLPGLTADQSLKRHHGSYLLRSTGRTAARAAEVRPQLTRRYLCHAAFGCCLDGNQGCCGLWLDLCRLPGEAAR